MKNIYWAFVNQIGSQTINVLLSLILTLFLSPTEFGVFTMIILFTDFTYILSNLGFGQALIKKTNPTKEDLNTVFWINILTSIFFSILIILLAKPIANFYNNPQLEKFIYFIPIGYIASSVGLVSQFMLIKQINYKVIFKIYLFSRLIAGSVAIYLAYVGFGVWSLIVQHIFTSILIAALSLYFYFWIPNFLFSKKSYLHFKNFSFNVFGNETLTYIMDNIDKGIIGKFLSGASLGLYSRAFSLTMLPVNNFPKVIDKFLFPYLSSQENNLEKLSKLYLKWFSVLAFVIIPFMFLFAFISEDFVKIIFNENWYELIPIMQVLSIAGLIISFIEINNSFFLILNKANILFKINIISRLLIVIGIFIGLQWDIFGVALSLVLTNCIRLIIISFFVYKYLKIKLINIIKNIFPPLWITIMLVFINWLIKIIINHNNHLLFLIISISFFILSYLTIGSLTRNKSFELIKKTIFKKTI